MMAEERTEPRNEKMTRIAIVSDIHADSIALKEALVQIERLRCDRIVCPGDLVDYGAYPDETIALIREREIPCIMGNHDRWVVENWNDTLTSSVRGRRLALGSLEWIASLPGAWDADVEGIRVGMRHGDWWGDEPYPDEIDERRMQFYFSQVNADILIVGHVHVPYEIRWAGKALLNPGAVLLGRAPDNLVVSDSPGGTFGILELPSRRFSVHATLDGAELDIMRKSVDDHPAGNDI